MLDSSTKFASSDEYGIGDGTETVDNDSRTSFKTRVCVDVCDDDKTVDSISRSSTTFFVLLQRFFFFILAIGEPVISEVVFGLEFLRRAAAARVVATISF